ncbi:MAG: SDR family oxidoreductase [Pseudomonadota bacterium]
MNHAFIIGCGDIGRRVAALWNARGGTVSALARTPQSVRLLTDNGIRPINSDLDQPASLRNLPVKDALLFYFAPPPGEGDADPRLRSTLAALTPENPPKRIVYISTTGVYGDCQEAWITEETPAHPRSARGARRLDAENALRDWQNDTSVPVVILRVPGIYGPGRLPVDRIKQGIPVVCEEESPYSNRIHADDLARICIAAAEQGRAGEVYNVSDGHPTTMTDYFHRVADLLALPRLPAISMAEARHRLSPGMLSFLEESKRIDNRKMLRELGVELLYPTLEEGLAGCLAAAESASGRF